MITKISKLKNFGIFYDFSWDTILPEFKKFNLIYGWNRSGKTTISRIFASCEKKSTYDTVKFKEYPETGEFEIKTDDGKTVKNTDVINNDLAIKVFNQDFIDEHISFNPEESCHPIFYQSKADKDSVNELKELKKVQETLSTSFDIAKTTKSSKETIKNNFLTGLGREIANILFNKSYNKRNVENKINNIGIDNFLDKKLSDEDKLKYEELSRSTAKNNQNLFDKYKFTFLFENETIDDFDKIYNKIKEILDKNVVSETIDRLKNEPDLNNWVKQGFDLHKNKQEKGKCLFCQQPLAIDFLDKLSKHFSKDYENLQNIILNLKNEIIKIKKFSFNLKNDELYPVLKDTYEIKIKELNDYITKTNLWIDSAIKKLEEKYNNPLILVKHLEKPEDILTSYNNIIVELNSIISTHNEKAANHSKEVTDAKEKLELHTISMAINEQDYKKILEELKTAETKEHEAFKVLNENTEKISQLNKKTSDIGTAIQKINQHLKSFFGEEEIELDLTSDNKGYAIKRNGKQAKNLSEGEKTAIAFSYFIVKVEESDFNKSKGIIFIDDPISSFDTNFIYHCFSLIKIYFREIGQLFISTHNFQLFNLVKEWFVNKNHSTSRDNAKNKTTGGVIKPIPCEFLMVENFNESNIRKAKIIPLDKTLKNHKSEYHFLFTKLKDFSEKQDTQYEDFYTVGNMARRFFDIFLDFKIPITGDQKSKMDVLIKDINEPTEKISAIEADKVYKLINEFSHNSDPTSTIEHKDKTEIKDAIKILLSIVKESDPKHYEILERTI